MSEDPSAKGRLVSCEVVRKWKKKRMKGGSRGTGRDGCVHSSTCHKINWGLVVEKFNSNGGGFVVIAPFRSLWVL